MPEQPVCGNPDHPRPIKAWVYLTWPEGPFNPSYACKGCYHWQVGDTLGIYERPVLVTPAKQAARAASEAATAQAKLRTIEGGTS